MIVIPIEARARDWRHVRGAVRRMVAGRRHLRAVEDIHRIAIVSEVAGGLSAEIIVDADGFVFQTAPVRIEGADSRLVLSLADKLVDGDMRLRSECIGSDPLSWTLETRDNARDWRVLAAMGVPTWRWWRQRDVAIHQNGDAARTKPRLGTALAVGARA